MLTVWNCVSVSSDVVWETKLKKRSRWKVLSGKEAAMLEESFQEYMENGPVDSALIDLENDYQVSAHIHYPHNDF